jgi:hypothetical protein
MSEQFHIEFMLAKISNFKLITAETRISIIVLYDVRIGTESYFITVLDRPLRLQEVEASRISRQSTLEGGKVVSPSTGRLYPPGDNRSIYFC